MYAGALLKPNNFTAYIQHMPQKKVDIYCYVILFLRINLSSFVCEGKCVREKHKDRKDNEEKRKNEPFTNCAWSFAFSTARKR